MASGTGSGSGSSNAPSEGPTSPRHATTTQPTAVVEPPPAPTPPRRRRSITEMLGHTLPASSSMASGGPGTTSQPAMEGGSGSGSGGVATATAATGGVIRQVERKRPLEAGEGSSSALRRHHAEQQQQQHPPPPPPPPPPQQQQQEEQNLPPPPPPPPVPPAPAGNDHVCTICGRVFPTPRGLFGHLRSHPNRAWRGAFPPPVFDQDEFADVPGQVNIQGGDNAGGQGNVGHAGIDINQPPAAEEPDPAPYLLPDLNNPPPPED
ncbi:hypothetical protein LguiB_032923 [Lonicera macranthoides]